MRFGFKSRFVASLGADFQVNSSSHELERSEVEKLKAELRRLQGENETLKNSANLLRAKPVENTL
jgi:cell division protein FtsB